jgi:hypothetical protein
MSYTLTIADTREKIEAIRPTWETLQWHYNADIDYFLLVCEQEKFIYSPYVISIFRDGKAVALIIGRIDSRSIPLRLGYKTFATPSFPALTIVRGGLLGEYPHDLCHFFVEHCLHLLRQRMVDVIFFSGLPCDHPLYLIVRSAPTPLCRDTCVRPTPLWTAHLTPDQQGFSGKINKKHAKKLRGCWRALEREVAGPLAFVCYEKPEDVDSFCEHAERIAAKTYHRGLGVGFADSPHLRQRLVLLASREHFRGYLATAANQPVAFWLGALYRGIFFSMHTGYDPRVAKYQCGTFLLISIADELAATQGAHTIDFGEGDAEYKQRFADHAREEASVYVFGLGLRTTSFSLVRRFFFRVDAGLRAALTNKRLQALKTRWRKLLRRDAHSPK